MIVVAKGCVDQVRIREPADISAQQPLSDLAAQGFGPVVTFGVEGTSSYGAGLTRFLRAQGQAVIEVLRPVRRDRRFGSKSDPIDADADAGAVLSGKATAVPKAGDAGVEMVRALKIAKQTAIKARTQAVNAVKGLIVMAPDPIREQLRYLKTPALVRTCSAYRADRASDPTSAIKLSLRSMCRRYVVLDQEVRSLEKELDALPSGSSHSCANCSASARMWQRPWSWRPATAVTDFGPKLPSQCCAAPRQFRPPPVWSSVTGSIAVATARPMPRCIKSWSSGCDTTRPPGPTFRRARPRASPRRRSSAASKDTSRGRSTERWSTRARRLYVAPPEHLRIAR